ncbi:MAG: GntR family transcriptional regulator [Anaerolineales bacterium]|nr:GntR family transcriptional regulator [Anaerolineales bacterium]
MPGLLRDQIYKKIKRDILTGVYTPGEQLSANQMAAGYSTSATPVREALNLLEQEGFVEVLPRIGFFVARITVKDIRDIYDYRIIIEGSAAELAARYIAQNELDYLESIPSDYVMGDSESYLQYLENNREFHLSIARASRNKFLAQAVASTLDQMQRLVYLGIGSSSHTDAILQAHPRLIQALRERDCQAAKSVMIEGIEAARDAAINQIVHGISAAVQPSRDSDVS